MSNETNNTQKHQIWASALIVIIAIVCFTVYKIDNERHIDLDSTVKDLVDK